MTAAVTKCGFTFTAHCTYIINTHGLNSWNTYTMIEFEDFAEISKQASRNTPRFTIGVIKIKNLKALKFWIEDKHRMDELPSHADFTPDVLQEYIQLYAVTSRATENTEFSVGPNLDPADWNSFSNGTEESPCTLI